MEAPSPTRKVSRYTASAFAVDVLIAASAVAVLILVLFNRGSI